MMEANVQSLRNNYFINNIKKIEEIKESPLDADEDEATAYEKRKNKKKEKNVSGLRLKENNSFQERKAIIGQG